MFLFRNHTPTQTNTHTLPRQQTATCVHTYVNNCGRIKTNTNTPPAVCTFAYLHKHNLICKFMHTCKCVSSHPYTITHKHTHVHMNWTHAHMHVFICACSHIQNVVTDRYFYSATHSYTCCCCHMLSLSHTHIYTRRVRRQTFLSPRHSHVCSWQACFHGNLMGKVLMKDFVIV